MSNDVRIPLPVIGQSPVCSHAPTLPFAAHQMSNDVRILLPVMVAIMIAKFVADAATHSLYHGLLEVKCVPFLPKDVSGSFLPTAASALLVAPRPAGRALCGPSGSPTAAFAHQPRHLHWFCTPACEP